MQERLEGQALKDTVGDDDRQTAFYAATLAAIERFSEQLDRKDRYLERKDERLQVLERENAQLRTAVANLQRTKDDIRSSYIAVLSDRHLTIERLHDEIAELERSLAARERSHLIALNELEIDRTRAQMAEIDGLIAQIQRSFFWRLKLRLGTLRTPLRSLLRATVRH